MVKRSVGPRSKTRHKFSKTPRTRGMPPPSHALREFPAGTKVDVIVNSAIHGGMPHSRFHGLTGTVVERRGEAYVVDLPVGNKHKTLVARPEHLRASNVRQRPTQSPRAGSAPKPAAKAPAKAR
jgi:large subunit ribosomal protein L21e